MTFCRSFFQVENFFFIDFSWGSFLVLGLLNLSGKTLSGGKKFEIFIGIENDNKIQTILNDQLG